MARSGLAFPIVLIALLVFGTIMFGISRYQVHQTRWTARALHRHKAFILADAGLSRALARQIARPYANRWYGDPPGRADDSIENPHAGYFDESSQGRDETGTATPTPLSPDTKLDPLGTYGVLVDDWYGGEIEGVEVGDLTTATPLDYTDVFSKGTIEAPEGTVHALVFARIAIAPEVGFFTPDPAAPETIKKIIRYRVLFDEEFTGQDFTTDSSPGRVAVQQRATEEIATYHTNFLKNRDTFRDLRDRVDASWNAPPAGKTSYTKDEVTAFFTGIAPQATTFLGTDDGPQAFNLWTDAMIRNYRASDLLGPNEGIRYLIDGADLPSPESEIIARNILRAFGLGELREIPCEFFEDAAARGCQPVTEGSQLLDLQNANEALGEERDRYQTLISSFTRTVAEALIIEGIFKPADRSPGSTEPLEPDAGKAYANQIFLESFQSATPAISMDVIVDQMRAEIDRINAILPDDPYDRDAHVQAVATEQQVPLTLRYDEDPANPSARQLSVRELVKLYLKYIEHGAEFVDGDPATITPPPTITPSPPPISPPPGGSGGNGSGGGDNGGGGSYLPGTRIGGSAAGI